MRAIPTVAVLVLAISGARAADWIEEMRPTPTLPQTAAGQRDEPGVVSVDPGFARILRFDKPFRTILVGDENVARVAAQSDRVLSVVATAPNGTTNLIVLDEGGNELFSGTIRVAGRSVHRVEIASKKLTHEYWTYYCTATSCHRTKDPFEGEVPKVTEERRDITIRNAPGASVPRAPTD